MQRIRPALLVVLPCFPAVVSVSQDQVRARAMGEPENPPWASSLVQRIEDALNGERSRERIEELTDAPLTEAAPNPPDDFIQRDIAKEREDDAADRGPR